MHPFEKLLAEIFGTEGIYVDVVNVARVQDDVAEFVARLVMILHLEGMERKMTGDIIKDIANSEPFNHLCGEANNAKMLLRTLAMILDNPQACRG